MLAIEEFDEDFDPLALLALGKATVAAAEPVPDSPHVAAPLHLSQDLRRCNPFISLMSGIALAERCVQWADAQGFGPTEAFQTYRPMPAEVIGTAAHEVYLLDRITAAVEHPGDMDHVVRTFAVPDRAALPRVASVHRIAPGIATQVEKAAISMKVYDEFLARPPVEAGDDDDSAVSRRLPIKPRTCRGFGSGSC